jgi:hypothetical protein
MSETAEFPIAFDAPASEREMAKREIAKYTKVIGERDRSIQFEGETIGQTGPIWHIQYTRLYRVPNGYLVAARDLHEGVKVAFARTPEGLTEVFDNPLVREFLEDELRYRKIIGTPHAE